MILSGFTFSGYLIVILSFSVMMAIYQIIMAIAALLLGVQVEAVSIGFGPRLIGFHLRGIDFCISLIPLGGYTRFQDDITDTGIARRSYSRLETSQKILILSSGPLALLLIGILILAASWYWGRYEPAFLNKPAIIGWCRPGSSLDTAGLRKGDTIVTLQYGGKPVAIPNWRELILIMKDIHGENLVLSCLRANELITIQTKAGDSLLGDISHPIPPVVGTIEVDSINSILQLQAEDTIKFINNTPITHFNEIWEIGTLNFQPSNFTESTSHSIAITINRSGTDLSIPIDIQKLNSVLKDLIDYPIEPFKEPDIQMVKSLGGSFTTAVTEALECLAIFRRESNDNSGSIARRFTYTEYQTLILRAFAARKSYLHVFIGFLAIWIGLFNMFPIPPLNGGLILITSIEFFRGRVIPESTKQTIGLIGTVILALLFFSYC